MYHIRTEVPENLRKAARFLRNLEAITPGEVTRRNLGAIAEYLERVANHVHRLEHSMGQAADAILKLESALATERATNAHLQSQLDTATANALDASDLAAIAGVDAAINPPATNGSTDTGVVTGTGTAVVSGQ